MGDSDCPPLLESAFLFPVWFVRPEIPLFGGDEGGIDERLREFQIGCECGKDALEHAEFCPLLEPAMAGLVWRVGMGKIFPPGTGLQHPENAIQHFPIAAPWSATAIGPSWQFREKRLYALPLAISEVHTSSDAQEINGLQDYGTGSNQQVNQ